MPQFHNTIPLHGSQLLIAHGDAVKQDEYIMKLFEHYKILSPSQCHAMVPDSWPLTSVRRAISNLSKEGKLFKTGKLTIGLYGKSENKWSIAP